MEISIVETAIRGTLDGMKESGPEAFLETIQFKLKNSSLDVSEESIVDLLVNGDFNSKARTAINTALARWDAKSDAPWANATEPGTPERRLTIFDLLDLSTGSRQRLDGSFPSVAQRDIVIAQPGPWDPWYTADRRAQRSFYWDAYQGVLERAGWDPTSVAALDESTSNIVGRLADPASPTHYQSKGLVVGYVQSGKTANFTGIVAKAIDSGYRLVIVLTGTIELLRTQTQRRLDMELVGEENILGGRDRDDPDAIRGVDYIGTDDADWIAGKFLRHGIDVNSQRDIPSIKRLTTATGDYKALKAGLDTLDFRRAGELQDPQKPLYDPANLFGSDVRLAVVKKNKSVLEKLLRDLHDVHASLKEIPVLVIDDEADQASVNTTNPDRKKTPADKERTAINGLISKILNEMPRAQYIGYTATPFANVFVSPDDSEDIFPKDFIISLEPAPTYMGGKSFHDLQPLPEGESPTAANSNEAAHIRPLTSSTDDQERKEVQQALDAFVLSGSIKLWRQTIDPSVTFRHHTMLAHESVRQIEHLDLADLIRSVWTSSRYTSPEGLARLKQLYVNDFEPTHYARPNWNSTMPETFESLKPFIGETIDKVTADRDPVVIVNGSKESDYNAMDFASRPYWRIMVGGAKLSRGFTVEGLTVSYYRRRAMAADTLMQMGRWFGYRLGYRDLVRLYIARDLVSGGKTYDLYDAFTSIIQDEEAFREQLRKFAKLDQHGRPEVRPIDVPPLVFQQLPWLKPTSATKMYNAELDYEGDGGVLRDFPRLSNRGDGSANKRMFDAVTKLIPSEAPIQSFEYLDQSGSNDPKVRAFDARISLVDAETMYSTLSAFEWADGYSFAPTLKFMRLAMSSGTLIDWAVMTPVLQGVRIRKVGNVEVQILQRARREERGGFSGSSFRQRDSIERIAGNEFSPGGPSAAHLDTGTRGALLLTFAADPKGTEKAERNPDLLADPIDSRNVASLFSLAFPYKSAPRGRIGFRVKDNSLAPIIASK
ncbi:MAG: Z1 domain-containing protein [Microbacteriaceae bacterium]